MKKSYTYDYETINNCFLAVYVNNKDPKDIVKFEVSDYENQFAEYIKFNRELIKQQNVIVSFNGLSFDSQVATYCLNEVNILKTLSGSNIAHLIFTFVQSLFKQRDDKGWLIFPINTLKFNEIDLAAINNYNNKQKFASLKWLQYNMDWHNVMDMNCNPEDNLNQKEIFQLTLYCINDCLSTRELLNRNKEQIIVRRNLSKHFGLNLHNLSEPKLAKAILLDLLSKDLKINKNKLKDSSTYRQHIYLKEIILPYIKFITPSLKETLSTFKNLTLDGENLKGSFKHVTTYRGLKMTFALGGIHGAKRGVYKREKGMIIKSFDVKSYYPNLCIRNKWSPAHLNNEKFCNRYEWFYDERLKYPKSNPLNYLYKIVLNSVYGLSNENHSFLKDSLLTMRITCNGQLLLVQLLEELCENIPGARPIMVNTDGGEIIFPKEYEDVYNTICKEWEKKTDLILEYEYYEKLIIWDVNNYMGVYKSKEIDFDKATKLFNSEYPKPLIKKINNNYHHFPVKLKGRFEINKALHKNKSYRIKTMALYNYFIHNLPIEKTLNECTNIYDYCAGIRAKGLWKIKQTCVEDGTLYNHDTQKTVRYFISKKGCKLIKEEKKYAEKDFDVTNIHGEITKSYKKGDLILKRIKVEADNIIEQVAIKINPDIPFEDYLINIPYYIRMINKEIERIQPKVIQTNLFK